MKLFIDHADTNAIRRLVDLYPIDGVTTNPSILAHAGKNPRETLTEIRKIIGKDAILFAQALALDAEGMVMDAKYIVELCGKNTVVKLPSIPEGFKAMQMLKKEGITTCGTVVYTPMQALLAAKAGASYVAPYVNRIDNMGYDGIAIVKQIQDILDSYPELECEILAASFKNSQQVLELCAYGIRSITAAPDVIDALVKNLAIDGAVETFVSDFEKLTGVKTMVELG